MLDLLDLKAIEELGAEHRFRDPCRVKTFLEEKPYLASLLSEASFEIKARFGQSTQLELEVVDDIEDGDRKLFAYILTPLDLRDALLVRDRFDDEWWFAASKRAKGHLILDLGFI
ncbi:MAG: hypothetical protein KIT57_14700 [Blastocatellales bacterium]|nr:hypothetical protein [Blastocatellales bacterium]